MKISFDKVVKIRGVFIRAVNGTRTRDPRLGKPMLYQLSYYRIASAKVILFV